MLPTVPPTSKHLRRRLVTQQFAAGGISQLSGWSFLRISSTQLLEGILLAQLLSGCFEHVRSQSRATQPEQHTSKCPALTAARGSLTQLAPAQRAETVQQTPQALTGNGTQGTVEQGWDDGHHQGMITTLFPAGTCISSQIGPLAARLIAMTLS